jgi:hypothetical protein
VKKTIFKKAFFSVFFPIFFQKKIALGLFSQKKLPEKPISPIFSTNKKPCPGTLAGQGFAF